MANPMTPMANPQLNNYVQNLLAVGNQGANPGLLPNAAPQAPDISSLVASFAGNGSSGTQNFGSASRSALVDAIAHAIRDHESGGNYNAYNAAGGARGAYQFINSTWNNLAKQFGRNAGDFSAANQDYIAKAYINQILSQYGADPGNVAQIWYTGHINKNTNYVPAPGAGNTQSVQQYIDYLRNATNKYLG